MPANPAVLDALPLAVIALQRRQSPAFSRSLLPHQIPPTDADWLYWLLMAGRGAGKTFAGAHYVDAYLRAHPGYRVGIIAPTLGDARSICVEGETGLLAMNPSIQFNRSWGELRWPNGSRGQLFGAYTPEDVERLRGPQHHLVWGEELAAWRQLDGIWDMMRLGLRLGERPHAVLTTTPRPKKRLKALMADPKTRISRAHTDDNPHLAEAVRVELYEKYGRTRLGRQELAAELLEDVPGALWTQARIEILRVQKAPDFSRVVVAVDPATTSGEDSDETGIVVAGKGVDGHGYVLADLTCRLSPDGWARRAVNAYHEFRADRIVAEVNNGGDMVERTIRTVDRHVSYKAVHATRGKRVRAEPVAALDEQGKVHHVGVFPELEDQMCSFVPDSYDDSPDRMDARVWAVTELMLERRGWTAA